MIRCVRKYFLYLLKASYHRNIGGGCQYNPYTRREFVDSFSTLKLHPLRMNRRCQEKETEWSQESNWSLCRRKESLVSCHQSHSYSSVVARIFYSLHLLSYTAQNQTEPKLQNMSVLYDSYSLGQGPVTGYSKISNFMERSQE